MYVHTTLKKKENGGSPLETGAYVSTQELREEDMVDERKPTTTSALSKKKKL